MPRNKKKERRRKLLFRGLLGGFPVFVLVIYLFFIHFPAQNLERLKRELSEIGKPTPVSEKEKKRRKSIRESRKRLRTILTEFSSPLKGVDRSTVGYRLSQLAKEAQLQVNSISFSGNTTQSGWKLLGFSMNVQGRWKEIVQFVQSLQTKPPYIVAVEAMNMETSSGDGDRSGQVTGQLEVVALVGVPWKGLVETSRDDAGKKGSEAGKSSSESKDDSAAEDA